MSDVFRRLYIAVTTVTVLGEYKVGKLTFWRNFALDFARHFKEAARTCKDRTADRTSKIGPWVALEPMLSQKISLHVVTYARIAQI